MSGWEGPADPVGGTPVGLPRSRDTRSLTGVVTGATKAWLNAQANDSEARNLDCGAPLLPKGDPFHE